MSDTLDCSNSLQPCNCSAGQTCIQVGRSGTTCAYNTCVDRPNSGGGGGKSNIGALAGQAVGGVVGGLLALCALYWLWRRRQRQRFANAKKGSVPRTPRSAGLKDLKMGAGNKAPHEKDPTAPPGPGEEDAAAISVTRSSVRIHGDSNGMSRRSLSQSGLIAANAGLAMPPTLGDNPFGDHHSLDGTAGHGTTGAGASTDSVNNGRASQASISDLSFRSSHSTNIIPIAYIPAHSNSHSIADLTTDNAAYGLQGSRSGSAANRHSIATHGPRESAVGQLPRSSRLSVPFSLRSSGTGFGDSLLGSTVFNGAAGGPSAFSTLFDNDRRPVSTSTDGQGSKLEVITNAKGPVSPPLPTPTLTKDGKPIRPPRAPGLDLKLPAPEPISPPPTSPGFQWGAKSGPASPAFLAPPASRAGTSQGQHRSSQRETLMSEGERRGSAYSTFSQATGSTASHMSYILDPPQIVTPVSAGRVEVQVLGRAAAKTVKLPHAASGAGPSGVGPSPLSRQAGASSPMSDNPFDDEAAVRIDIPESNSNTPTMPHTPTFGTQQGGQPGSDARQSHMSHTSSRRDSDLSIFTSASAQGHGDASRGGTARNSLASAVGHSGQHPYRESLNTSENADEVILEPPRRPFTMQSQDGGDSRHNSAALSMRSGYASVLEGIPFNLSLSPDANRNSNLSAASGPANGTVRDSAATFTSGTSNDKRDTTYSLASEWNGAFAGMPIVMGGPSEEAVPELPSAYANKRDTTSSQPASDESAHKPSSVDPANYPRYSTDSLAMAAAVARSFGDGN